MANAARSRFPQTYARTAGFLYLFIIVAALFGETVVRGNLIVPDPSITGENIQRSETLFRLGLAAEILTCVCDTILALIFYLLLKPVSRHLALLGAIFRLVFVGIYAVSKLFEIAALVTLGRPAYLDMFTPQQLYALAHMSLGVHSFGYGVSLLFFGICTAIFGYLIYKSGFLPKAIGGVLVVGGVGYICFSLIQIVSPGVASAYLFPWLMLPAFFGELGLALWLSIKGIDVLAWKALAGTGRT